MAKIQKQVIIGSQQIKKLMTIIDKVLAAFTSFVEQTFSELCAVIVARALDYAKNENFFLIQSSQNKIKPIMYLFNYFIVDHGIRDGNNDDRNQRAKRADKNSEIKIQHKNKMALTV